uniref:Uncharacterized protein n=1 Tax=Ascaris lumbricoides TaxID=6252 RepID=A0A0M3HKJ6_ASCLU
MDISFISSIALTSDESETTSWAFWWRAYFPFLPFTGRSMALMHVQHSVVADSIKIGAADEKVWCLAFSVNNVRRLDHRVSGKCFLAFSFLVGDDGDGALP